MSSLVKLFPKYKYLAIPQDMIQFVSPTSDKLGAMIPGSFTYLSGRDAGEEVQDTVQLNQVIKITPSVPVSSKKYTLLIGYNPALADVALVNCPSILPPGEDISITIKALKQFDIAEFTDQYTFIVYAID